MKLIHIIILVFVAVLIAQSDPYNIAGLDQEKKKKKAIPFDTIYTNHEGEGNPLTICLIKGEAHNHPLFAVWTEDLSGNYIQTLYVAQSIGTSVYNYGDASGGKWTGGTVRRPAALPYWSHKRGVKAPDGLYMPSSETPVPDAYSGATPGNNCIINTRLNEPAENEFFVLVEINQPWDWNEYWTNNKYPDNEEYKTSAQPAVVYRVKVDPNDTSKELIMEIIGHSHYAGEDGSLTESISTLSSSLEILETIKVSFR